MSCPNCNSNRIIKKGKRNCIQRYQCRNCGKHFQDKYTYKAYDKSINPLIISLLKEGSGIRGIARVLQISKDTVLSRMIKIAKAIKPARFNNLGCKFEIDELWSFIGIKTNVT